VKKIENIELERARFAYECARIGASIAKEKQKWNNEYYCDENYTSYVKKIPTMIKTNGLGATFAFINSKRLSEKTQMKNNGKLPGNPENPKNAYDLIYEQTRQWLHNNPVNPFKQLANGDLMEELLKLESEDYRLCTFEVLAFFQWLRRFAEGVRLGEQSEEQQAEIQ